MTPRVTPNGFKSGARFWPPVVKRTRVLETIEEEAGVPYEETRLARQAIVSRRRLIGILLVGALVLLLEAAAQTSVMPAVASVAVVATAWGVHRGRLGGTVAAALLAVLAMLLPVRMFFITSPDASTAIALAVSVVLGIAALPSVVTLLRDAELQHTYGRWARRSD